MDVLVAPTYIHLDRVLNILEDTDINVASQDVAANKRGAFTGSIAAD
jgi:triosephosphate isomerase